MDESPEHQQETQLTQELPLRLSESVEKFKDSFEEGLSAVQVEFVHHMVSFNLHLP